MWVLFHVFSLQNSHLNISFYRTVVQLLNQVKKLKNAQFHEDLMLFFLDNNSGTLITLWSTKKAMVNH